MDILTNCIKNKGKFFTIG